MFLLLLSLADDTYNYTITLSSLQRGSALVKVASSRLPLIPLLDELLQGKSKVTVIVSGMTHEYIFNIT